MSSSTLTLIGMYNEDPDLFRYMDLPTGIDTSILIDTILLRGGEFEVIYPEPSFLEFSIGAWSRKWSPTFDRWVSALSIEYNPLENYDRNEEWEDTNTGTQTVDNTGTQTTTNTGTQTVDDTGTQTTTNTGTQTVDDTGTQTTTNTGTQTTTNTGTQTTSNTGTQTSVASGSESTVKSGSEKEQADGGSTTENQTSAYDSSTYSPKDKTIFDTDQSNERTYNDVTDTHTLNDLTNERTDDLSAERTDDLKAERTDDLTAERTDDLQSKRTDDLTAERTDDLQSKRTDDLTAERTDDLQSKRTDDLTTHHEGRVHGNIGVTTSQQMLTAELDLGYWNIYNKITDLFLTEFVIPIY